MWRSLASLRQRVKNRLAKRTQGGADSAPDVPHDTLDSLVDEMGDQLLPHVARRLGTTPSALKQRLTLRMANQPLPQSFVAHPDRGDTLEIGMTFGMMMFLHKILKVFASRVHFMDENGQIGEAEAIPFQKSAEMCRKLLSAFRKGTLLHEIGFKVSDLSEEQIAFSENMLMRCERFAIGHEYGHVMSRLAPRPLPEIASAVATTKALLPQLGELTAAEEEKTVELWPLEIGADLIGVRLSLMLEDSNRGRVLQVGAAELFLILMRMVEEFHIKELGRIPLNVTHPPGRFRLAALRSALPERTPPEFTALGRAFEQMADVLLQDGALP